jgi:hypothetical protein
MLALALDFGATMSDAQVAEFIVSLWERQREYEEELLGRDDADYRRDSYDSLVDFLRPLVGELSPAQEQRLRTAAGGLQRFDRAWLEERALWLRTLEPLLQRKPDWQQQVQAAYATRKQERTPRYKESLAHNLALITAATADVLNQLSADQRKHLAREFDDLRTRLRNLMDAPRVTGGPGAERPLPGVDSLAQQVMVEADGPEIVLDRDVLIDTVYVLDGVRIHAHGQEAIDIGRQGIKELGIGPAAHHVRRHQGVSVHGPDGPRH